MSAAEVMKFTLDPLKYVLGTCINLQTASGSYVTAASFNANAAHAPAYFDLVPWSTSLFGGVSQVMLEASTANAAGRMAGYYVPYINYGAITSNNTAMVLLDNVPASNPPYKYIFTGGQNGCSLLLLRGTAANTVAALHYPNSDGKAANYPLLAKVNRQKADIILAIDFDVYGETNNPNAASFFFHTGTEWIGVTQPQVQGAPSTDWKRVSMSINKSKGPLKVTASGGGVIT
jgi:hypothetical protein